MQVHSSFHFNPNNDELSISLKDSPVEYKIGKLPPNTAVIKMTRISNLIFGRTEEQQSFHFAHKKFYLNRREAASLQDRTISILPFSDFTKSFLKNLFGEVFKQREVFESELAQIIDAGRDLDQLQTKCNQLLAATTPLSQNDLAFIFNAEAIVEEWIADSKKNKILEVGLLDLYHSLISPLVNKAKQQIKVNVKHLATAAAADKGKAMQAGLSAILDKEKKADIKSSQHDKVFSLPSSGVVYKKGSNRSQEEERQADSLMSLSMEHGTVSFFTFSDLSAQRFEHLFSSSEIAPPGRETTAAGSESQKTSSFSLQQVEAKPYVEGMLTFDELIDNKELHQSIMQRLNSASEIKAVLTAELQFLDLHPTNLGLVPLLCQEHEFFCDMTFSYQFKSNVGFAEFYKDFLLGYIDENTEVFYSSKDNKIKDTASLKNIPNLLPALNSAWEFILFDTDLNLAESNELQTQIRDGKTQSLIPFRSALLASDWKNKPLDAKTLGMLQDKERIKRMRQWVNREDAPIRQFLTDPQRIDQLLKEHLEQEKYTLSYQRAEGNLDVTIKDLQKQFAEDMSDLETHQEFWTNLQQQLSATSKGWFKLYKVQGEETVEEIASHHNLTIEELIELNPELIKQDQAGRFSVEPGMQFRVKADLTSQSSSAQRQRQTLAAQFFPRLSWKQRNALFERQDRCREYLSFYQALEHMKKEGLRVDVLEEMIYSEASPLSTSQRETFKKQIDHIRKGEIDEQAKSSRLEMLKSDLQRALIPTYFNVVKAMYPLLADAYDLNLQLARQNHQTAGLTIGVYSAPLEEVLSQAKKSTIPETKQMAQNLERAILKIKDTKSSAFFGEWETGVRNSLQKSIHI